MSRSLIIISLLLYLAGTAPAQNRELLLLSNVTADMLNPDFWISLADYPDREILTRPQVEWMNMMVYVRGHLVHPLYEKKHKSGRIVSNYLANDLVWLKKFKKYDKNDVRLNGPQMYARLRKRMNFPGIPRKISNRFSLVCRPTYLRAFPTSLMVMKKTNDYPFDILQKSALDPGEEVTMFHRSLDGKWAYVQTKYSTGWVKSRDIAWTYDISEVSNYLSPRRYVVVTDPSLTVYRDKRGRKEHFRLRMAAKLPVLDIKRRYIIVKLPARDNRGRLMYRAGYIMNKDAVSFKYLRFTQRNVARQAFKMLAEPYSWGGQQFHTDCSSYLMRVFATMGVEMPRSSITQVEHLKPVSLTNGGDKRLLINELKPFSALLYHGGPGHVMLYVGNYNGRPYVIHNKWSYWVRRRGRNEEIHVKQVVVSDLSLGEGSYKGSMMKKLSKAGRF